MAQFGSALQWGCRGRRFESSRPDHLSAQRELLEGPWWGRGRAADLRRPARVQECSEGGAISRWTPSMAPGPQGRCAGASPLRGAPPGPWTWLGRVSGAAVSPGLPCLRGCRVLAAAVSPRRQCPGRGSVPVAAVSSWRQCLRRSGRSGVSEGRARSTARSPLGSIGVRPAEPPRSHGSEQREVGRSARGSQATGAARGRCGPTRCTSAPTPRRRPMLASRTLSQ